MLRTLFRKRRKVDQHALERVLAAPPPDHEVGVPFQTKLPIPIEAVQLVGHAGFVAVVVLTGGLVFGALRLNGLGIALLTSGIVITVLALLLQGGLNFVRRLDVSDGGIVLHRVAGSSTYRWWEINEASATPDLSDVQISGTSSASSIALTQLPEDRRAAIANAIRARLLPDRDLHEWHKPRWSRQVFGRLLHAGGSALLLGSIYIGGFVGVGGGVLGVRCSGPSAYLSQRFGVPRQPGCVFIRVSGPAALAGIRQGDQMIAMDGTPVTSGPQFNDLFITHKGTTFTFEVVRAHTHAIDHVRVSFGAPSGFDAPSDDPITHFLEGKDAIGDNNGAALTAYSKAIEIAPDFDLAYVGRGEAYSALLNSFAAERDYQKAIELDPDQAEALRAIVFLVAAPATSTAGGMFDLATRAIRSDGCDGLSGRRNHDCALDYSALEFAQYTTHAWSDAIASAARASEFDPDLALPYQYLTSTYIDLGDGAHAEAALSAYQARLRSPDEAFANNVEVAIEAIATCGAFDCGARTATPTPRP